MKNNSFIPWHVKNLESLLLFSQEKKKNRNIKNQHLEAYLLALPLSLLLPYGTLRGSHCGLEKSPPVLKAGGEEK